MFCSSVDLVSTEMGPGPRPGDTSIGANRPRNVRGARPRRRQASQVGNIRFRAVTNDVFEPEARHYLTVWMEGDHFGGEPRARTPRTRC